MSEQSQDTTETTETTEASIEPVAAPPESSASPDDLTAAAGSTPSDWKTLVPEYGREFQEVKDAKDFDSFFKQYDQLRSYQGQSVRIPGEDASDEQRMDVARKLMAKMPDLVLKPRNDEERAAYYDANGRPTEASGYSLDVEGFEADAERMGAIKQAAHDAGLSAEQFSQFVGAMAAGEVQGAESVQEGREEAVGILKSEWGQAFESKVAGVQEFMRQTGAPESFIEAEAAGNFSAAEYQYLDSLVQRTVGEGNPAANHRTEPKFLTPGEAQHRIDDIRGNPEHPFNNERAPHADRARAQQEMLKLYEALPGGTDVVSTPNFGR